MIVPTRGEALERLANFVPRAGRAYRATRNEDRGPSDRSNVSTLAPYIRTRLITEEEVLRAVLAEHSPAGAEKFVQEVFWRTYWKGWLESRPEVWRDYRTAVDSRYGALESDDELARAYLAAIEGRTQVPAFNAWARELSETGYLHNHARMWFASIWMHTLRLPWELGADYFMRQLLCGDPAANTLSWRWVAGLHTRGKTYRATRDNIRRYTDGRLDAGAALAARADALAGPTYAPEHLRDITRVIRDDEPAMLLLHDDDAGLETLPLESVTIAASAGVIAAAGRSPRGVSEAVRAFTHGALTDALSRAPRGSAAPLIVLGDHAAAADALADHARAHGIGLVVAPYAPVGPVRDALDAFEPLLASRGVRFVTFGRAFDALAWPHATRGYFGLKAKIPSILETLGVRTLA